MASLALSTHHAKIRMQQRAIPGCVIDWLIRYGNRERALNDASLVYFDKRSRRRLMDEIGAKAMAKTSCHLNAYLIELADGTVVTAGWRTRRVIRDGRSRDFRASIH
ncbi:hypothetical protein GCM10007242_46410 [Pigmentiphaga litoralis]|nr:hypothetical protein GCM10007242_46410 [Pigmentiphaga litoralis]